MAYSTRTFAFVRAASIGVVLGENYELDWKA